MSSCLGIYISDSVIKYAKLSTDKDKIKLDEYGTRFVRFDKQNLIDTIINETDSKNVKLVLTPDESQYVNLESFDNEKVNSYFEDIVKMEVETWCERNNTPFSEINYIYKSSDLKNVNNKRSIILNIIKKKDIDSYTKRFSNIASIYPANLLTNRLVSKDESNYVLVDFSDTLTIMVVINNQIAEIQYIDTGMKQILKEFSEKLGTYQKAYEACKQMNVYSEGIDENNKGLETILEPILQEILRRVQEYVEHYRQNIDKVLLTGNGIIFTNIDILFTEYLGEKCEILRPNFLEDTSNVRNTAEILEVIEPIALAYDYLRPLRKEHEYINFSGKNGNFLTNLFAPKDNRPKEKKPKDEKIKEKKDNDDQITQMFGFGNFNFEKIGMYLISSSIVIGILLLSYVIFANIYVHKVNKMKSEINDTVIKIDENITEANSDISYITNNSNKYKEINDDVQNLIEQIESNKIGKLSTYNVAAFMQNVIKIIPKGVQLVSISSDDNKNVRIVAQSDSYANLGYFVAELKINGTLNNVAVVNVKNASSAGSTTSVEIGGELP